MNVWDHLTSQAHTLLTGTAHRDLTPSVKLVQGLHPHPPATPAAICSHLDTASTVLPELTQYAQSGDPHALLLAAVLMRNPLRKIAEFADPDGYHSSDYDARHQDTLAIFFTLIRSAAEPQLINARYLWAQMLKRTITARPKTGSPAVAIRLDPSTPIFDQPDYGPDDHTSAMLDTARERGIITALEHTTLKALYLSSGAFDLHAASLALGAKATAVERRAQRAIRKLALYHQSPVAA
ncbi:Uncharacterised protein [Mycobacteroides abscessus subsp. abscessus]|uniref:hypothetical protein n=1 Tax=Mycobacteroides abscessus TaxID=36809 RepID=UPI000929A0C3|nr:hypothetical protein [Mycobacteroides abscessus]SIJ21549.1 Uncharacterised protein [Mycobacteroides abscessus subsp. abscessus]SLH38958.1 Uncharacterised protein [Mycobacteroides abscessus subsp. abscessus]